MIHNKNARRVIVAAATFPFMVLVPATALAQSVEPTPVDAPGTSIVAPPSEENTATPTPDAVEPTPAGTEATTPTTPASPGSILDALGNIVGKESEKDAHTQQESPSITVQLKGEGVGNVKLTLVDSDGKEVAHATSNATGLAVFDTSTLPAEGKTYEIKLDTKNTISSVQATVDQVGTGTGTTEPTPTGTPSPTTTPDVPLTDMPKELSKNDAEAVYGDLDGKTDFNGSFTINPDAAKDLKVVKGSLYYTSTFDKEGKETGQAFVYVKDIQLTSNGGFIVVSQQADAKDVLAKFDKNKDGKISAEDAQNTTTTVTTTATTTASSAPSATAAADGVEIPVMPSLADIPSLTPSTGANTPATGDAATTLKDLNGLAEALKSLTDLIPAGAPLAQAGTTTATSTTTATPELSKLGTVLDTKINAEKNGFSFTADNTDLIHVEVELTSATTTAPTTSQSTPDTEKKLPAPQEKKKEVGPEVKTGGEVAKKGILAFLK